MDLPLFSFQLNVSMHESTVLLLLLQYFDPYLFSPLSTQIYHCYVYSENNLLSCSVMILQAAHMYLEDGFYHKYPLQENQIFSSPHHLYNRQQLQYILLSRQNCSNFQMCH